MYFGKFDRDDLKLLIQYLNLPNVKDMFEVSNEIIEIFPELNTLFRSQLKNEEITYISKSISEPTSNFLSTNILNIKEYCRSIGWEVSYVMEWVDYTKDINGDRVINESDRDIIYGIINTGNTYPEIYVRKADLNADGIVDDADLALFDDYMANSRLMLTIKRGNRQNYFPNKDMLKFVNQFTGSFMYGYAIDSHGTNAVDGMPHIDTTKLHKIALYECKPGQKVTIAHNNNKATDIVIGCSSAPTKKDITSTFLDNIVHVKLNKGQGYQYTCASDIGTDYSTKWLCIECPSNYDTLVGGGTRTVKLNVGDINFDGKIDMIDYNILASYTATGPGAADLPYNKANWTPSAKQLAVMNCDESSPEINTQDAVRLYNYITGQDPSIISLGFVYYSYDDPDLENDVDNINNLLIIDGHYYNYNEQTGQYEDGLCDNNPVDIPFAEFTSDDWVIHEKFFNYLLGMAIHKYSPEDDIAYLQTLMKQAYPQYADSKRIFYPGIYTDDLQKLVYDYQSHKTTYYLGDVNRDGKLNYADLELMQNYLDDQADIELAKQIVAGEVIPTSEMIERLDKDGDGEITENDVKLLEKIVESKYSDEFINRFDVNQDGYRDIRDYNYLKDQIDNNKNDLRRYQIPFAMGWYDVQTEGLLEQEFNALGKFSEVSK